MDSRKKLVAHNFVKMEDHLHLAGMVTKWMCRSWYERDEVWSAALDGLWHAAKYWEPGQAKFSTYAVSCMVGTVQGYRMRAQRFRVRNGCRRGREWQTRVRLFSEMGVVFVGGNANLFAYEPDDRWDETTSDLYVVLVNALNALPKRTAQILRMLFGLVKSRREYTLGEVAKHFGVTKSRIRQIAQRALDKLRDKEKPLYRDLQTLFESIT